MIAGEYIGVGLGAAAFVAFMARETNPLYTATQLALFIVFLLYQVEGLVCYLVTWLKQWATIIFLDLFIPRYPRNDLFIRVAPWNEKGKKA